MDALHHNCESGLFLAVTLMLSERSIWFYNLALSSVAFPTNPWLLGWSQQAQIALSLWEPEAP